MDDLDDYYKEEVKKSMRKNGYVKVEEIKPIKIDWSKYSSPDNIEFIEVEDIRDSHASKKHPFDVFVKSFRYKYKGYGQEGVYNMSVMEEEVYAVKRGRAKYENKPELEDTSLAEKNSMLYRDKKDKGVTDGDIEDLEINYKENEAAEEAKKKRKKHRKV